ncbi:fibronectin type III domain-containing protein 9 [Phasianus colchicus]|nr:fibronectin type III domain-containing protein 9 [Phasianus colchicus]
MHWGTQPLAGSGFRDMMNIDVHNITYTSATVSWTTTNPCPENYYHVMYRPNWNSVFAGYLRQNFHREEQVPHSLSSVILHRLTPSTIYVLCITCKNSYPSSNHCTTFHTLDQNPLLFSGSKHEPTTSMWMVSSLLLLCFIALLVYGCLQFWAAQCCGPSRPKQHDASPEEVGEGSSSLDGPLNDGLKEELLEVPMTTVLMRSSSFLRESPYSSPRCFFPYKNSDDKTAILPQHGLQ